MDSESFRPASVDFGATIAPLTRCRTCGHVSLDDPPSLDDFDDAYQDAADEVSIRERPGQLATAHRDLTVIEAAFGRSTGRLVDIGCWTGSFVAAAAERGWDASGVEPSSWAVREAQGHGLTVQQATLGTALLEPGTFDVVVATDIIEHLLDLDSSMARLRELLTPDGVLFFTLPDAGSRLARVLGARWWAVLPMHVQYFTRASFSLLLARHGLEVESLTTHPKIFSRRYYMERLEGFLPAVGRPLAGAARAVVDVDTLTGLDFRDRMAVLARPISRDVDPSHTARRH